MLWRGPSVLLKLTEMPWYWRAEQYIAQSLPGLPTTPPILTSPAKVVDLLLEAQAEAGRATRFLLENMSARDDPVAYATDIRLDIDEQARCAGKSHAELNYPEARTGMLTLNDEEEMLT